MSGIQNDVICCVSHFAYIIIVIDNNDVFKIGAVLIRTLGDLTSFN